MSLQTPMLGAPQGSVANAGQASVEPQSTGQGGGVLPHEATGLHPCSGGGTSTLPSGSPRFVRVLHSKISEPLRSTALTNTYRLSLPKRLTNRARRCLR